MNSTLAHLPPVLLLPAFSVFWLLISWLISLGAWAQLARFFPAKTKWLSEPERVFRLQSAMLKRNGQLNVSYSNVLTVGLSGSGLHLNVLFLFRFQHPPLFIPWSAITPITTENSLWGLVKKHSFIILLPDGQRITVTVPSAHLAGIIAGYQAI